MKTLTIIFYCILLSLSLPAFSTVPGAVQKDSVRATLTSNSTGAYSPYYIKVEFDAFQDSLKLFSKCKFLIHSTDNPIDTFSPQYKSASTLNDSHEVKGIDLFSTLLSGNKKYIVDYLDSLDNRTTIVVANDSTCPDSSSKSVFAFARWLNRNTKIDLDVRQIIRTQNALAVDYQLEVKMYSQHFLNKAASTLSIALQSSGKISPDSGKTPNAVDADVALTLLNSAYLGRGEWFHYGIRIPVGFEGPQSLNKDSLQFSAKIQAVMSVPYISDILLWWHRVIEYNQPFYPPTLYAGYTYTHSIVDSDSNQSRFDGELVFNAPLAENIEALFTGRTSYVDKEWKTSFDVATNLSVTKVVGFILKYSRGELAPFFRKFENFGMGVSVKF